MRNPNVDKIPVSCWRRLESLLNDIPAPTNVDPIQLHIGDPQHAIPDFMIEHIVANTDQFLSYAPIMGTPNLRREIVGWLNRRYHLDSDFLDPEQHCMPVCGLREAMYLIGTIVIPQTKGGTTPLVAIPDPFYHAYVGAATSLGAEPLLMPATKATGFLPNLNSLEESTLARLTAFYLCTPSNPQGIAADKSYFTKLIQLAREYDFTLLVDECYADIYTKEPPLGILEICAQLGGSLQNVLTFHSLSKRSNVPGLRSGFVAGDPNHLRDFRVIRDSGGVAMPLPVQAASAALWQDDLHADSSRQLYRPKFEAAERILGDRPNYYEPDGGMFLWLYVEDCEVVTRALWAEQGVRVLPGRYMSLVNQDNSSAGDRYIRVALVPDQTTTEEALTRIAKII